LPSRRASEFVCDQCGSRTAKWAGRCPNCGEWDSLNEVASHKKTSLKEGSIGFAKPKTLSEVSASGYPRLSAGMPEVDRVFGGGLVAGSMTLLGGEPGIGKSTLLLQMCDNTGKDQNTALYASGEESPHQIKMRATRLGINGNSISVLPEVSVGSILNVAESMKPKLLIIDSIQTAHVEEVGSAPGSVTQIRESAARFLRFAKNTQTPIVIAGHVTKEGNIAGPRALEHLVDVVLYLEGDAFGAWRILRGVKNRFGATFEVAVLEMRHSGLIEITNPSEAFLSERQKSAPGSAIAVTIEGTRALMVEVQALVNRTVYSLPKRISNGIDSNRLTMLVAVLDRRANLPTSDLDIYVNVVGGLRIAEPAADLPVALAIASSIRDTPINPDLAAFGEIGLSGEIRSVSVPDIRIDEVNRMLFKSCLVPKSVDSNWIGSSKISSIREALDEAFL